jgi:integrase
MAHIEERRGSGWLVSWREAETGKRKSRLIRWGVGPEPLTKEQARTRAEEIRQAMVRREPRSARAFQREFGYDPMTGDYRPEDYGGYRTELALANFIRAMIAADVDLRDGTRDFYLTTLRTHIEGTFLGRHDIRSIEPETIKDYWTGLDLGAGARRNVGKLLRKTFRQAVQRGLIGSNPMDRAGIHVPTATVRDEPIPLEVDEVERLAAAAPERDRLMILLMAYAGLRAGEVAGLREQDVSFAKCQLTLRQQVVRNGGGKVTAPLKTRAARRTVSVACSVTDELRAFLDSNPPASDGRIFHRGTDGLLVNQDVAHAVRRAAKAAGLRKPIHPHLLRHTSVSLLIDDGANPRAIQVFAGHSNVQMTLQTYGHLFDSGGTALADSMERRREAYRSGNT